MPIAWSQEGSQESLPPRKGCGQTGLHDSKEAPGDEARATEAVPVIHQEVVGCEDPAIIELRRQWVSDI